MGNTVTKLCEIISLKKQRKTSNSVPSRSKTFKQLFYLLLDDNETVSTSPNETFKELRDFRAPKQDLEQDLKAVNISNNFSRKPFSPGPVLNKNRSKLERSFVLQKNLIKSKCLNFEQSPVWDKDIVNLMSHFVTQVKIYKWNGTRNFTFDLTGCKKITDKSLEIISKEIRKHLFELTHLSLIFSECSLLKDKSLEYISNIFSKLSDLKTLDIQFNRCPEITDKGLQKLGASINRFLPRIKQLSLGFNECPRITEGGLRVTTSKIPRKQANLKNLTLSFNSCPQISDTATQLIGKRFGRLEQFHFSLSNTTDNPQGFGNKGFQHLCTQIFKYMNKLQILSLNLNSCININDKGIQSLALSTKNYNRFLKSFALDLGECRGITNQGLETLALWLNTSLPNLGTLKLNLNNCIKLDGKGLEVLSNKLSNMQKLKHLFLKLGSNNNFIDKSFHGLAMSIKTLRKLTNLSLNFYRCNKITDKGFDQMLTEIRSLSNLQYFSLNFSRCEKLTNKSLESMEYNIGKYLYNLRRLIVDFRGIQGITYDMKGIVRNSWTFHSKLELF